MKLIIPLMVIPVLAAFALVGCNQNTPDNSTGTQSTNSSASDAGSASAGITNAPANNNLPAVDTNAPAGTNQ
jgi:hypothetical protein